MAQLGYLITVTELRLDTENFKKSTGEAWSTYEKRIKKFYNQTIPPDPGPSPIPSNRPPDQSSPTSCCCNLAIELGVRGPGPWTHTHVHRYTVRLPCAVLLPGPDTCATALLASYTFPPIISLGLRLNHLIRTDLRVLNQAGMANLCCRETTIP